MKKLFIFLLLVFFIILNGCEFSTNPADHNLPTMEELIPVLKMTQNWKTFSPASQKAIIQNLIQEKEFFYKYANKIYVDNPDKREKPHFIVLAFILYNDLKKNHPNEFKKFKANHTSYNGAGAFTLMQIYYSAMIDYKK
jgi:hypothetical protein